MELAIGFLVGLLVGIFIAAIHMVHSYYGGTLRIDKSDPDDKPYIFLVLDKGVGDISSKKHVLLRVKLENFIPHK